jgi:DNA-directed RNA polymerase beta subunit
MRPPNKFNLDIQTKLKDAIESKHSTIQGRKQSLHISNVHFDELPEIDDYKVHKETLANKDTLAVNMYGTVALKDKEGNLIEERKKVKLSRVPIVTNRFSFIVNGKEYIVHNQMRLRPAIYTKLNRLGEAQADFNLSKGTNFTITYMPAKQQLMVKIRNSHVPLYTILKDVYEMTDKELIAAFGQQRHLQEMSKLATRRLPYIKKLHELLLRKPGPDSIPGCAMGIKMYLNTTVMDPVTNARTMGKRYGNVSKESLLHAATDIMEIYQGKKAPTWKDNLAFKSVHGVEDFLHERLTKTKPVNEMHNKLKPRIDNADKISKTAISREMTKNVLGFFKDSNLVNYPMQINPMEFMENAHKVTPLGEGGVASTDQLPLDARNLHTSHVGWLDPVRTPDNLAAGIDLRSSLTAWKDKDTLKTLVIDKKGKYVEIAHTDLYDKYYTVATEPPQSNGKYRAYHKGKMLEVPKSKIDYYMPADSMFTVSTAAIPFLKNTQGQRCAMGAKMTTQALSLINREKPLVDTNANKIMSSFYNPHAKANGTVKTIDKHKIVVRGEDGKDYKYNLPDNLPLNYHSYLDADLKIKVGDKVKKGQLLADNNFTKDGITALGMNLKVAFMPIHGFNFEDGFAISESCSKRMTSNHLFSEELDLSNPAIIQDQKKYLAYYPNKFTMEQIKLLVNGVVKKGTKVHHGDPLVIALKEKKQSPEVLRLGKMSSRLSNPFGDAALTWEKDYPGEVIDVIVQPGKFVKIVLKAQAPMVLGDKIAGRYGNKGIITKIIPDAECPKMEDGSVPDVFMNPAGIPSRMNVGQVYETMLAKVQDKVGKPIHYQNMNKSNTYEEIKALMKKHGVKDTEDLKDPVSGKTIPKVFTGKMYMYKLFKQTELNYSARAGGDYDIDMRPVKGGEEGAKSIGSLDFYGFLAHNSRALLREAGTYKAEYNPDMWQKLLSGQPLPPPKSTFTYEKVMTMLKGMGINVKKEGNYLKALPFTDKDILAMSKGEISSSAMVTDKPDPVTGLSYRPEKGGIFDPGITGGLTGEDWGHIKLTTPVVNTLFEKPIRALLDIKQKDFQAIAHGKQDLNVEGEMLTGGAAFKAALSKIDVERDLKEHQFKLENETSELRKDKLRKKIKYLRALKLNDFKPEEAYLLHNLPVIPPKFRPIYPKETGEIVTTDANHLYRDVIQFNEKLNSPFVRAMGTQSDEYRNRYDEFMTSVKKLQGLDGKTHDVKDREPAGFLEILKGKSQPKYGYFQGKLLSRAQDIAARGTIAPDPSYGLDECGLPEPMCWTLFGPFVIGKMVRNGYSFPKAQKEMESRTQTARSLLQAEMNERPVILNRAPTLHKFSVMAFKAKMVQGKTIFICPLVVSGFGADFDGDTMTVHVPLTEESKAEAFRMMPSNNLFNPLDKRPMHTPSMETKMGLYLMTKPKSEKVVKKFATVDEAKRAFEKGEIALNDKIEVVRL